MICKVKVIGTKRIVSKSGVPYLKVWVQLPNMPEVNGCCVGEVITQVPDIEVKPGSDVVVAYDRFGNVKDIEI